MTGSPAPELAAGGELLLPAPAAPIGGGHLARVIGRAVQAHQQAQAELVQTPRGGPVG